MARALSAIRVVLASGSPRRRQLLDLIGIAHEVRPSDIDESMKGRETPRKHAERLAREKVEAVASKDSNVVTIAADTIVVIDRKVLGKPTSSVDAGSMLSLLNGREHTVIADVPYRRSDARDTDADEVRNSAA